MKDSKSQSYEIELIDKILASRLPVEDFVGIVDGEEVRQFYSGNLERIIKLLDQYSIRSNPRYRESASFSPHALELALAAVVYQCLQNRDARRQLHGRGRQTIKDVINFKIKNLTLLRNDPTLLILLKIQIEDIEEVKQYLTTRLDSIKSTRTGPIKPISRWLQIVDFNFEFLGKSRYWMVQFICDLLSEFGVEDMHGELVDEQLINKWFGRLPK